MFEGGDAVEADEQLVKRVLNGETEHFREIVTRYQTRVYAIAYKVSRHEKDAEDITQDIFLQIYRSLHSYKHHSTFSTWLYRVAMNKALDYKRKAPPPTVVLEENEYMHQFDTPESALIKKTERALVMAQLNELPPRYRDMIQYYYVNQYSYKEIAYKLGIAEKTVESRLYRAKKLLKAGRKETRQ